MTRARRHRRLHGHGRRRGHGHGLGRLNDGSCYGRRNRDRLGLSDGHGLRRVRLGGRNRSNGEGDGRGSRSHLDLVHDLDLVHGRILDLPGRARCDPGRTVLSRNWHWRRRTCRIGRWSLPALSASLRAVIAMIRLLLGGSRRRCRRGRACLLLLWRCVLTHRGLARLRCTLHLVCPPREHRRNWRWRRLLLLRLSSLALTVHWRVAVGVAAASGRSLFALCAVASSTTTAAATTARATASAARTSTARRVAVCLRVVACAWRCGLARGGRRCARTRRLRGVRRRGDGRGGTRTAFTISAWGPLLFC